MYKSTQPCQVLLQSNVVRQLDRESLQRQVNGVSLPRRRIYSSPRTHTKRRHFCFFLAPETTEANISEAESVQAYYVCAWPYRIRDVQRFDFTLCDHLLNVTVGIEWRNGLPLACLLREVRESRRPHYSLCFPATAAWIREAR